MVLQDWAVPVGKTASGRPIFSAVQGPLGGVGGAAPGKRQLTERPGWSDMTCGAMLLDTHVRGHDKVSRAAASLPRNVCAQRAWAPRRAVGMPGVQAVFWVFCAGDWERDALHSCSSRCGGCVYASGRHGAGSTLPEDVLRRRVGVDPPP